MTDRNNAEGRRNMVAKGRSCEQGLTDRLSEYLDGELSSAERADIDAHLHSCATCPTILQELRAVKEQAASLPFAAPAADLWPGIETRLEARGAVTPFGRRAARRFSFTLPQLVAAAAALMLVSGGGVWLAQLGGRATSLPPLAATTTDTGSASGVPPTADIAPVSIAAPRYDEAIHDLEQALEAGRAQLDPGTLKVLESNLHAIDRAIDQSRAALQADPANVYLQSHLADARLRKLALLRRASALVTKS